MTATDIGGPDLVAVPRDLEACAQLLDDARDGTIPAVRRVGLVVAFSRELDKFFASSNTASSSLSGRAHALVDQHGLLVHEDILPTLAGQGVSVLDCDDLTSRDRALVGSLFEKQIHPVLTPLTVDATHPFPYIASLGLNLAVSLRDPDTGSARFARIEVPAHLPRLAVLGAGRWLPLEQIIAMHLSRVFPGMSVQAAGCFRVTRGPVDLVVDSRRYAPPSRLEVDGRMRASAIRLLMAELGIVKDEVYRVRSSLVMGATLWALAEPDLSAHYDAPGGHRRGAA